MNKCFGVVEKVPSFEDVVHAINMFIFPIMHLKAKQIHWIYQALRMRHLCTWLARLGIGTWKMLRMFITKSSPMRWNPMDSYPSASFSWSSWPGRVCTHSTGYRERPAAAVVMSLARWCWRPPVYRPPEYITTTQTVWLHDSNSLILPIKMGQLKKWQKSPKNKCFLKGAF